MECKKKLENFGRKGNVDVRKIASAFAVHL